MPPTSMTGFARASFVAAGTRYNWELKSVNGRGLDIRLRLPNGLDHLENDIRQRTRQCLSRGNCQFALQEDRAGAESRVRIDEAVLALVTREAARLAATNAVAPPSADGLLALPGVLSDGGTALDEDAASARDLAILEALQSAIARLLDARREEGARLAQVLAEQIDAIERLVAEAASLAEAAPATLRARIGEQVSLLLAEAPALDPDRLHQEAVLAATRADIREELDRLTSHIAGARKRLDDDGPVGRRLEFLAQELNREANTICSKAFDIRLTEVGMEMKAVIDQFREQVQNIE